MKQIFMGLTVMGLVACNGAEQAGSDITKVVDGPMAELLAKYPVSLAEIAPNVWVQTNNYKLPGQNPISSNGLVVIDGDEITLVDGAWGEMATYALIDTVQKKFDKPVTKLVATHYHMDRIAGVDVAEAMGIEVFVHPDTPALAAKNGYPVPNTNVAGLKEPGSRTKLGAIELAYPGPGHSVDNLIAYVAGAKVLYGGCAIKGADAGSMGYTGAADMKAWPKNLNWIKATYPDAQIVVPGHGRGADLFLIDKTLAMIAREVNQNEGARESDTP